LKKHGKSCDPQLAALAQLSTDRQSAEKAEKTEKKRQTLQQIYNQQSNSFKVEPITVSVNPAANIIGQTIVNDTFYRNRPEGLKKSNHPDNIKIDP
jgi:hypothetical protein